MKIIKKKILKLQKLLCYHDYLYYALDEPIISDDEYDFLVKKLQFFQKKYSILDILKFPNNNMKLISYYQFELNDHSIPMLSLSHTFHISGLLKFYKNIKKVFQYYNIIFFCELKFDGLALSLLYQSGKLVRALTRGTGIIGENVTKNAYMINNIPKYLYHNHLPEVFEVRGEVCMLKKDLDILNMHAIKNKKKIFSNTRNAAAGTLRQNNIYIVKKRNLFFYSYSLHILKGENNFRNHSEQLFFLYNLGFKISTYILLSSNLDKILKFYFLLSKIRSFLSYDIDGIVIKVDSIKLQNKIGYSNKFPKWAIAFKFLSKYSKTKLLSITYQVGRTGLITPIANLKPILLSGVIIKKASLHNKNLIRKFGLYIGDSIIICRSGDVIPKIISVVYTERTCNNKKVIFPIYCPSCASRLSDLYHKKYMQCLAGINCFEQKKKIIQHFFSKDGLYAKGFGMSIIQKLILYGGVHTPLDCFKLDYLFLSKLKIFGEKTSHNIISVLQSCKNTSLKRFIYALGIPNIGIEHAGLLADFFQCFDNIFKCTIEDLLTIKNFGRNYANIFFSFITHGENIQYIKKLTQEAKLIICHEKKNFFYEKKTIFMGKNIVLSGKFQLLSRIDMIHRISNLGGKIANNISKKIDFLIIGNNPGKKLSQAINLKIKIIQENEVLKMI